MSAPSQCVKWMMPGAAMPGKQILRSAGESRDLVGKDRTANEHVIVFGRQSIERNRHIFAKAAVGQLDDFTSRNRAELGERRGIVPSVIEDASLPGEAILDRVPDERAQLGVAHRRVRAECNEIVERRHARPELALERLEHQRHRHGARAVGNKHQHAAAVDRQPRKPLARDASRIVRASDSLQ